MPQHDYDIVNAPGATVRADINNALSAIASQNSGPTAPTFTVAYMIWVDTTSNTHKQRNSTDSAWIILHKIESTITHKDDIGANIASASIVDLATATGKTITVTGSVAITSFGTVDAGFNFTIVFSSNPVITHNVTSLILPGGANITAAAGDVMQLVSLGSGNWRVTNYTRADGESIIFTPPPDASETVKGIAELATQAELEAATDVLRIVTPGRQKFHPGMAKAWVNFNGTGTPGIRSDYNIDSITDNGIGRYTVNITNDFSSINYVVSVTPGMIGTGFVNATGSVENQAGLSVGSALIQTGDTGGSNGLGVKADFDYVGVIFLGDQ